MTERTLREEIELVAICAGRRGFRSFEGGGHIWAGNNSGIADGSFTDWGLARAVTAILNAVSEGRLKETE